MTIATGGAGLRNYVLELIEGKPNSFSNYWTERGIELEDEAKNYFQFKTGILVKDCGFIINKKYPQAGASPDGLIGEDAVLEVKCPSDKNFSLQMIRDEIPTAHYYQVQMQMMITERELGYYVVYSPNFRERLIIKKIKPELKIYKEIELGLKQARRLYKLLKKNYEKVIKT